MASVGQDLKRERELRGISLKEIADATKINQRFLRSLEEDQFESLPGKFFTKGIIREYAKYIGLDENAVLNNYLETCHYQEQQAEDTSPEETASAELPRRTKTILSLVFVFVLILVILSAVHFILRRQRPAVPLLLEEQVVEEAVPPPSELMQIEPVEEPKQMDLVLYFNQETWIQAYADGELMVDGIKHSGERETITAVDEIVIHLGNAGGLSYTLNEKAGKPFGPSGAVRKNIRITLDNMQEFIIEKQAQAADTAARGARPEPRL